MSEDETGGSGGIFQRIAAIFMINRFVGENAMSGMGFNRAATWVAMISAITGGVIGLSTYRLDVSKRVDESVEKTFEMIQAYNGSDIATARSRVMSYVYARRECDARYIDRNLTDDDYIRVLEFYDLVHACVDAGLCDQKTAIRFFEPHASFQWPVLTLVVDKMQDQKNASTSLRSDTNFALGMKAFAKPDATAPACDGNF
ncbi:MAG: hypothetical protein P8H62_07615 [Henriciella sp.]|nr:hypothetical protein [Henriciella sp.]